MTHEVPHIVDGLCECECPECMYWVWDGSVKYSMCRCVFCNDLECGLHEEDE